MAYVHVEKITLEKPKEMLLRILCNALSNDRKRKNIEAVFIKIMRPSLNELTDSDALILFRNGVT